MKKKGKEKEVEEQTRLQEAKLLFESLSEQQQRTLLRMIQQMLQDNII